VLDPIIITGLPRSRTSMTTQIMELCGVFLGDVIRSQPANPQGQCEHRKIIDKVQKAHLRRNKFDPKGQNPLPPRNWHKSDPARKDMVLRIMKQDGLKDGMIWGFKDSKATLDWRTWNDHFPNAKWIITERKDEDVIKSCLRTSFMSKYKNEKGWQGWIDEHKKRFNDMYLNLKYAWILNTDEVVAYNFDTLELIVEELGLTWDYDKVYNQIQPIN
jgi:hypothetical protein